MLKMNLQMFADEVESNPEAETESKQEKSKGLTQDEVNRLIAQTKSKAKDEAKKEQESELKELRDELEELRKNSMTTSQLKEYEEEERKRKDEEKDKEIQRLQAELTQRDMRDKAISTLTEKGLPISDDVLSFVVKDTAEDTLNAIDAIGNILTAQKRDSAIDTPMASGGVGRTESVSNDDLFKKAKITQF